MEAVRRRAGIRTTIEWYFREPYPPLPKGSSLLSTLMLNRQEVLDCWIGRLQEERIPIPQEDMHRLFATATVMFAGIDLLSKLRFGDEDLFSVRTRFIEFLREYAKVNGRPLTAKKAAALWRFRNALVHNFALRFKPRGKNFVVRLRLHCDPNGRWVTRESKGTWETNLPGVYEAYLNAIENYRLALLAPGAKSIRSQFTRMFRRYGRVRLF